MKKGPLVNLSGQKSTLSGPHIPVPTEVRSYNGSPQLLEGKGSAQPQDTSVTTGRPQYHYNHNDMLSYSSTTMLCFVRKELYVFCCCCCWFFFLFFSFCVYYNLKAYHWTLNKRDLKLTQSNVSLI